MVKVKSIFHKISEFIVEANFPLPIEFIKWVFIDFCRFIKNPRATPHIYGIWCFVGIYGGGKTISMVNYLERIRAKYGNDVYIATNFFYKGEDFKINSWKDLLPVYDKPVVFAYDELQNEFNSRDYKGFPVSLMVLLTQNRKGNGKQIVYTTQDYETVDKNFRRLTQKVAVCKTKLGRLTISKFYDREDYENLCNTVDVKKRMKIRPYFSFWFVQSDYIRGLYNSYQMLDSATQKTYTEQLGV